MIHKVCNAPKGSEGVGHFVTECDRWGGGGVYPCVTSREIF